MMRVRRVMILIKNWANLLSCRIVSSLETLVPGTVALYAAAISFTTFTIGEFMGLFGGSDGRTMALAGAAIGAAELRLERRQPYKYRDN